MPSYQVTEPRFHKGVYYAPGGKRPVLTVDKPFSTNKNAKTNRMPSGLVLIPEETAAEREERLAAVEESKVKTDPTVEEIQGEVGESQIDNAVNTEVAPEIPVVPMSTTPGMNGESPTAESPVEVL